MACGSDLYFSHRISDNEYYLVVVRVKKAGEGEVSSAYPVDSNFLRKKQRELRPTLPVGHKRKGRMNKSLRPLQVSLDVTDVGGGCTCKQRRSTREHAPQCPALSHPAGIKKSIAETTLFFKSIPAGARWITVFPNGRDNKDQPLLVQEEKNGTMRVIGGAGGKLNYLKLKGVRSESEYKAETAARHFLIQRFSIIEFSPVVI